MTSRREALAWLGAVAVAGCAAPRKAPSEAAAPAVRLRLDPLVDIVPAAGLQWLVLAKPRELFAGAIGRGLEAFVPAPRWEGLAERYGGVDVRQASDVVVAGYAGTTLALARTPVDPARVEAAFAARAVAVEGRVEDHEVIRLWGTVDNARVQVAIFGKEAVGIELGRLGPLRPAVYFAQGRFKRALPALRVEPLAAVAARVGDAPLQAFAPGPFEGPWSAGLGGLLRAATAAAASARPAVAPAGAGLGVRVLLAGGWGDDASAAAARLGAAFQVLADDPLGRLLGVDQPLAAVGTRGEPDLLALDVLLDPATLTRGLRAATGAGLAEILGLTAAH